jgi:hypothetical protein
MTPEELNRTIDYILQIQARMAAKEDKHEELLQQMVVQEKRLSELIVIESGRVDQADEPIKLSEQRLHQAERENRAAQVRYEAWETRQEAREKRQEEAWQKRYDELMREIRSGLDRIFEIIEGGRHENL